MHQNLSDHLGFIFPFAFEIATKREGNQNADQKIPKVLFLNNDTTVKKSPSHASKPHTRYLQTKEKPPFNLLNLIS